MAITKNMLYNFEVHAHTIRRMTTPLPEGGTVRLAFKLADYPTLMVDCGGVYHGEIICEKGKSCMLESEPTEMTERLPLSLRCMLIDVREAEKYHIIASNKILLGNSQRGSSLSISLKKYDLVLNDGFGKAFCEVLLTIHLSLLGPYHNGDYQLPSSHSVHSFLESDVNSHLQSLLDNTTLHLQTSPLSIADCGPTASAVFSQQVSLLQQLQHNSVKLFKIVSDAHYQKTGLQFRPVRRKKTKKKKKLIVRNIVIEASDSEEESAGSIDAHALLFVAAAGCVAGSVFINSVSDNTSPLFLPNPDQVRDSRYDMAETDSIATPIPPRRANMVPPPVLSKSPIKIHEKRSGDTGYTEHEYLHDNIPPVGYQIQREDANIDVIDDYNTNIENDEGSFVLHHTGAEEVSTAKTLAELIQTKIIKIAGGKTLATWETEREGPYYSPETDSISEVEKGDEIARGGKTGSQGTGLQASTSFVCLSDCNKYPVTNGDENEVQIGGFQDELSTSSSEAFPDEHTQVNPPPFNALYLKEKTDKCSGHHLMFRTNDGKVCKEATDEEEKFYAAEESKIFRSFIAEYTGSVDLTDSQINKIKEREPSDDTLIKDPTSKKRFILLRDVECGFKRPCMMDIKMGIRGFGLNPSQQKRNSKNRKSKTTTSASLGMRIHGMKLWRGDDTEPIVHDKYKGRKLTEDTIRDFIKQFVITERTGYRVDKQLCAALLSRVQQLIKLFEVQESCHFYTSSLLVFFDMDSPVETCNICMIDFAFTYPVTAIEKHEVLDSRRDTGYLLGLKNISSILTSICNGIPYVPVVLPG